MHNAIASQLLVVLALTLAACDSSSASGSLLDAGGDGGGLGCAPCTPGIPVIGHQCLCWDAEHPAACSDTGCVYCEPCTGSPPTSATTGTSGSTSTTATGSSGHGGHGGAGGQGGNSGVGGRGGSSGHGGPGGRGSSGGRGGGR